MSDHQMSEVRTGYDVLTQEMISEFKEVFSVFDKDGNGLIKIKYLKKVFKCLGQEPTQKEIDEHFAPAGTHLSGTGAIYASGVGG